MPCIDGQGSVQLVVDRLLKKLLFGAVKGSPSV